MIRLILPKFSGAENRSSENKRLHHRQPQPHHHSYSHSQQQQNGTTTAISQPIQKAEVMEESPQQILSRFGLTAAGAQFFMLHASASTAAGDPKSEACECEEAKAAEN